MNRRLGISKSKILGLRSVLLAIESLRLNHADAVQAGGGKIYLRIQNEGDGWSGSSMVQADDYRLFIQADSDIIILCRMQSIMRSRFKRDIVEL